MHDFSKRFQIWKKSHKVIICCHQVIVGFCGINWKHQKTSHENLETALQRCSYKKVFWKYATNLQEKTHAEMWLLSNCIEIMLWYGCSPVNLLHIFRTPFYKNTSGGLLVKMQLYFWNLLGNRDIYAASKVSPFGVILVRYGKDTNQNNSKYGHLLRSTNEPASKFSSISRE